ncbi:Protein tyrosine and serine/threonine kinase [Pelomyxa schiedti]|nr:Protein tyrosine and serine/threonine kinase [Pelomyxa schiedti]
MEVEKRFGVDENQQVVSLVVGATQEVSLSDTSSTLSQLFSLLPQSTALSSPGKEDEEEASNTAVAQVKVRMKPVMTIMESDLSHVSTLGSGCYGTVYKYIHTPSSKEVAVKTLFEVLTSPHNVERFRLEAEIVSGLRHPNIVKCLGTCTTTISGKLLIVSELMCCSLRQLLKHVRSDSMKQRLDFKQFVSISLGVANGMDSLHRQNIMHRDLSSNNVLFDSNGVPKICDFERNRVPFTVIVQLLRCCCTSAAIHDVTTTHRRDSSSCTCTTTTTVVTDDQVTECVTQWLYSLSPFIHHLAAGAAATS